MSSDLEDITIAKPNHLGGGNWILKNRTPITIVFGKNGSGKSLLLRDIASVDPDSYHYSVPEKGGQISFQAGLVQQQDDGKTRYQRSKINLNPEYRQEVITRIQNFLTKRGFNAQKMENENDLFFINSSINRLLSDFSFNLTDKIPHYNFKRSSGESITTIETLSSGEIQIFSLALDLLVICNIWRLEDRKGMLLIDEPDCHLHPESQQKFSSFLVNMYDEFKVPMLVSTHSTTLLSSIGNFGTENVSVIYLDKQKEEQIARKFDKIQNMMATCLGGQALMGPLFGYPLVLVEGSDDYRIWSQVPRHHLVKLSVIPCGGDLIHEYQQNLEQIFSSLLEDDTNPVAYAIIDHDKEIPKVSQNHVKYLRLECHESENLFLTNEVLKKFGLDWNEACTKVIQEAPKFGEKESLLKEISNWDKKTVNCKKVINELAMIWHGKSVPWSLIVGQVIGPEKPEGELAEFLGTQIIETFWNSN